MTWWLDPRVSVPENSFCRSQFRAAAALSQGRRHTVGTPATEEVGPFSLLRKLRYRGVNGGLKLRDGNRKEVGHPFLEEVAQ